MTPSPARPRVAITDPDRDDSPLAAALAAAGAEVVRIPALSLLPPPDPAPLAACLSRLAEYRWVVFTSRHAVEALEAAGAFPLPGGVLAAAAGPSTAESLARAGAPAAIVARPPGARTLAAMLSRAIADEGPSRILWPRSTLASAELADLLRAAGADVDDPAAYEAAPAASDASAGDDDAGGATSLLFGGDGIGAVCFMSPSAARGLAAMLGGADLTRLRGRTLVASIGPTTSDALARLGAPPDLESTERTAADLARAVLRRLAARPVPIEETQP